VTPLAMRARLRRRRLLPSPGLSTPGWEGVVDHRPRVVTVATAALAGAAGWLAGGPVAATAVAVYAALAATGLLRRRTAGRRSEAVVRALDATAALAADLRAGATPAGALSAALPAISPPAGSGGAEVDRLGRRVSAAWAVSEAAGAPLADLLDRLALDAWSRDRIRQAAAAQAAGVAATAWLLAALPLAGIGVGYGMGADPLRVLLHTPTGAGCALLALALQVAGLAWSRRLTASLGRTP
jgi:tight adherence protein B